MFFSNSQPFSSYTFEKSRILQKKPFYLTIFIKQSITLSTIFVFFIFYFATPSLDDPPSKNIKVRAIVFIKKLIYA